MSRSCLLVCTALLGCRPPVAAVEPTQGATSRPVSSAPVAGSTAKPVAETSVESPVRPAAGSSAVAAKPGVLDKDDIREVVRGRVADVRGCYNTGLARDPALAGRVTIQFTIGPAGGVTAAVVQASTLPEASRFVAQCIATLARNWQFPAPQGGGEVRVSYPFLLDPGQRVPSSLASGTRKIGDWFAVAGHPPGAVVVEVLDATSHRAVAGAAVNLTIYTKEVDELRTVVTDGKGLAVFSRLPVDGSVRVSLAEGEAGVAADSLRLGLSTAAATILLRDSSAGAGAAAGVRDGAGR